MTNIVYSICLQFETHRFFYLKKKKKKKKKKFYLCFESCKMSVILFGSMLPHLKGHETLIVETAAWPNPFLFNVFTALKGSQFQFLFAITAAGVVSYGGPKKSPRTLSIVQVIFSFWSFQNSEDILRNQKFIIG